VRTGAVYWEGIPTATFAFIRHRRSGVVMVVAMIFMVVLSALALSLATVSGTNVQVARNQIHADRARACAESGLQVMRYWFNQLGPPPDISYTLRSVRSVTQGIQGIWLHRRHS